MSKLVISTIFIVILRIVLIMGDWINIVAVII